MPIINYDDQAREFISRNLESTSPEDIAAATVDFFQEFNYTVNHMPGELEERALVMEADEVSRQIIEDVENGVIVPNIDPDDLVERDFDGEVPTEGAELFQATFDKRLENGEDFYSDL